MTKPNEPITPCLFQRVAEGDEGLRFNKPSDPKEWNVPMNGLTKLEYFASTVNISNEVEVMISQPNPDYWSEVTGIKQPADRNNKSEWATFWFSVEAAIKVIKAKALIEQLNKQS